MPDVECDIVVIGAGVAGITASIELKKIGLDVWLLGSHFESQIAKAGPLSDVTSIPEGTVGLDHIEVMEKEATDVGVQRKTSLCTGIEQNDRIIVKTKHQKFICDKVLIATGAKQKKLDFSGEKEFFHKGISDCAVCDFPLYRNKTVAVIGNHKYTLKAVEVLIKNTLGVYLFWNDATEVPKVPDGVQIYPNVSDIHAFGSEALEGVKINSGGQESQIDIQGLFVEGKPVPSTEFLVDSKVELDNKYIKIDEQFQTTMTNVWAVGDATGKTDSFETALIAGRNVAEIISSV